MLSLVYVYSMKTATSLVLLSKSCQTMVFRSERNFFVNSFRIKTHKIIHGNGWNFLFYFILFHHPVVVFFSLLFWYEVSKIMWVMSVWKFSLSLTYLHVHCSPIISIIHDDLLISFNAQHKKIIDRWKWNFMFLWLLR
jgi:hypothetical protein